MGRTKKKKKNARKKPRRNPAPARRRAQHRGPSIAKAAAQQIAQQLSLLATPKRRRPAPTTRKRTAAQKAAAQRIKNRKREHVAAWREALEEQADEKRWSAESAARAPRRASSAPRRAAGRSAGGGGIGALIARNARAARAAGAPRSEHARIQAINALFLPTDLVGEARRRAIAAALGPAYLVPVPRRRAAAKKRAAKRTSAQKRVSAAPRARTAKRTSAASAARQEATTMAARKRGKRKAKWGPGRKRWIKMRVNPLGLPPEAIGAMKVVGGLGVGVGASIAAAEVMKKYPMNKLPTAASLGLGAMVVAGVVGKYLSPAAAAVAAAPLVTTAVKIAMLDHDGFKDASNVAAQHLDPRIAGVMRVRMIPQYAGGNGVAGVHNLNDERAYRAAQIQRGLGNFRG